MKIEIRELFKVVTSEEGKILYNGEIYAKLIYTPLLDNPEETWLEVDESEYELSLDMI